MKRLILVLLAITSLMACGARVPSAKSAASMTESFFRSYAKKHKSSFIGQAGVDRAQVNGIREVARNMAEVDAVIVLKNGQAARVLLTTQQTPPLGWKISSWELLGGQ